MSAALVGYSFIDTFHIEYLTNPISTCENFLVFPNRTNFEYTMSELKKLNSSLLTPDLLEDSLPQDPILERFESSINNFLSLRKKIENEIDSLSHDNVFYPDVYDPDDHFIGDLYYRAVLNHLMEVQIGEKVYKVKSSEWVTEFAAGNPALLGFARNYNVNNLVNRIDDTTINGIEFYYTGSETLYAPNKSSKKRGNCLITISKNETSSGNVTFTIQASAGNCSQYHYDFGDGTSLISGSNVVTHQYQHKGSYLVTVWENQTCPNGESCNGTLSLNVTTALLAANCSTVVADFADDQIDLGIISVHALNGSNFHNFEWITYNADDDGKEDSRLSGDAAGSSFTRRYGKNEGVTRRFA